jgi:hypothetical protein
MSGARPVRVYGWVGSQGMLPLTQHQVWCELASTSRHWECSLVVMQARIITLRVLPLLGIGYSCLHGLQLVPLLWLVKSCCAPSAALQWCVSLCEL